VRKFHYINDVSRLSRTAAVAIKSFLNSKAGNRRHQCESESCAEASSEQ